MILKQVSIFLTCFAVLVQVSKSDQLDIDEDDEVTVEEDLDDQAEVNQNANKEKKPLISIFDDDWNIKDILSNKEVEGLRTAFDVFDIDDSGSISADELAIIMDMTMLQLDENEIQRIIEEVDGDKSDDVDFQEFLNMISNRIKAVKESERILKLFNIFDRNNDGLVGADEFKYAMDKLDQPIKLEDSKKMVEEVDKNNNGKIDFVEFVERLEEQKKEEEKANKDRKSKKKMGKEDVERMVKEYIKAEDKENMEQKKDKRKGNKIRNSN